jgi:hypothetical protein
MLFKLGGKKYAIKAGDIVMFRVKEGGQILFALYSGEGGGAIYFTQVNAGGEEREGDSRLLFNCPLDVLTMMTIVELIGAGAGLNIEDCTEERQKIMPFPDEVLFAARFC